jgi:hypothetical protein
MTAGWYEINRDFPTYIMNGTQPGTLADVTGNGNIACVPTGNGTFSC